MKEPEISMAEITIDIGKNSTKTLYYASQYKNDKLLILSEDFKGKAMINGIVDDWLFQYVGTAVSEMKTVHKQWIATRTFNN